MPEMNGLDFVKTLRNTPATSQIPIVIVTANAASDDIQHALELGVKGYILKPFTVETMKDKIDTLIAQMPTASPAADREPAPAPAGAETSLPTVEAETGPEPELAVEAGQVAESEPAIESESESESDFDAPADLIAAPANEAEVEPSVVA